MRSRHICSWRLRALAGGLLIVVVQGCADITQPSENGPFLSLGTGPVLGSLTGADCIDDPGNWSQLRSPSGLTPSASSTTTPPPGGQPLTPVIVYGNPTNPRGGYGAPGSYGATITYVFDRYRTLAPCEFGEDYTWQYAPDTLRPAVIDVPAESPYGPQDTLWSRLSEREKSTLRRLAKELAELPGIASFIPYLSNIAQAGWETFFWDQLGRAFLRAKAQVQGMRGDTRNWVHAMKGREPNEPEYERIDAFTRGCASARQFIETTDYAISDRMERLAAELGGVHATDLIGHNPSRRYHESRLSLLAAIGAHAGREGNSCAQTATSYFQTNQGELFDPGSGGGGTQF